MTVATFKQAAPRFAVKAGEMSDAVANQNLYPGAYDLSEPFQKPGRLGGRAPTQPRPATSDGVVQTSGHTESQIPGQGWKVYSRSIQRGLGVGIAAEVSSHILCGYSPFDARGGLMVSI